jgi:hypothetical protein
MNPGVPREKLTHLSQITGNVHCLKLCGIIIPSHIGTYLIGTNQLKVHLPGVLYCTVNQWVKTGQNCPSRYVDLSENDISFNQLHYLGTVTFKYK